MGIQFQAVYVFPDDCVMRVNPQIGVMGATDFDGLLMELKKAFQDSEDFEIAAGDGIRLEFKQCGLTAGHLAYTHGGEGKDAHVHAISAFLARLDDKDDRLAFDSVRGAKSLQGIRPERFDERLELKAPIVATFFTNQKSLDYLILYDLIRVSATAFFDQFGLVQGEG